MEHTWVTRHCYDSLPSNAVLAGYDSDEKLIFVGRAYHNGDVLPAKLICTDEGIYAAVAYKEKEIVKQFFEVLTGDYYKWMLSSNGEVPPHALRVGETADGETLYMGRGPFKGSMTPGTVQPTQKCLYIPYGYVAEPLTDYEVLVQPDSWVSWSSGNNNLAQAVLAANNADGDGIYVGRAYYNKLVVPAKIIPNKGRASVSSRGKEVFVSDSELLVGCGFAWVPDSKGNVPACAVRCGCTSDGEPLYIGRGEHQGSSIPGQISKSQGGLHIPFCGLEVHLDEYEVLVRA